MRYVIFSNEFDDYARDYDSNRTVVFKTKKAAEKALIKCAVGNITLIGINDDSIVLQYGTKR